MENLTCGEYHNKLGKLGIFLTKNIICKNYTIEDVFFLNLETNCKEENSTFYLTSIFILTRKQNITYFLWLHSKNYICSYNMEIVSVKGLHMNRTEMRTGGTQIQHAQKGKWWGIFSYLVEVFRLEIRNKFHISGHWKVISIWMNW